MAELRKCSVTEGKFVEPCELLERACEGSHQGGKSRGIFVWDLFNIAEGTPSRSFFGSVCSNFPKGLAFNFCPFCGELIGTPFMKSISEDTANG